MSKNKQPNKQKGLPLQQTIKSSSHDSVLLHGRGFQQGPQGNKKCEQTEAQPLTHVPPQAHPVHVGHNGSSMREGVDLPPICSVPRSCSRSPKTSGPSSSSRNGWGHMSVPMQELSNVLATIRKAAAKKYWAPLLSRKIHTYIYKKRHFIKTKGPYIKMLQGRGYSSAWGIPAA